MNQPDKPIFFGTPMVQAILGDRKTQTRRVMKPQPFDVPENAYFDTYNHDYSAFTLWTKDHRMCLGCGGSRADYAHWKPRYLLGDVLWVRETWCELYSLDGNDQPIEGTGKIYYAADNPEFPFSDFLRGDGTYKDYPAWRSSRYMPRKAARLFLRVTDVRAERVRDISDEDAKAEGVNVGIGWAEKMEHSAAERYAKLWDNINAKRKGGIYAWEHNPWVWVYTFERIEKPSM